MPSRVKVFFDGGCRPNPGPIEVAVLAAGQTHLFRDLGQGTNGDAEWLALIHALRIARTLGTDFVLLGDAVAVIGPANGTVKCRGSAANHLESFRELAGGSPPLIRYVKRAQNLAGIALAGLHPR
ncbi:ribonuclease HI [Novosphingobium sp. G106]|uniref:ribonuclease HI n=1 Tax=Novosphingobium sp. G106 TaxID=2849500 RepID=UPI001C2DB6AD|nr:ribonuclease HI [Novosphingobium sp. G106]MBV1687023.1 ribonuclease HI [Novosphingobium sp. G106]